MRSTRTVLLLTLATIAIAGCSKRHEQATRAGKGGKKLGGRYTLNEIRGNPGTLDPARMTSKVEDDIGTNIFDKLIDNNTNLELVPELATRWEAAPDGKMYTFHLRTDAFFHDDPSFPNGKGRKFTAQDVKYTFERVCNPKELTAGYWIFQDIVEGANAYFDAKSKGGNVNEVTGFKVVDDSTFVIQLIKPFAPFLQHLTTSFGYIVPKEAVEKYGKDFFQHPVGTGPFVFVSWKPDQEIFLKRNPNYWEIDSAGNRLPLLDEVRFTMIKDDKALFQTFVQGGVDEDFTLPTESFQSIVTPDKQLTAQYEKKYVLQHIPAMNSYFIDMLCTDRTLKNMALRRALSFAVDRDNIVKYVLKSAPHSVADHGIVPPAFGHYPIDEVKGILFNMDSARYWLDKAGYPNGKGLPTITLSVYNEPRPMQIAEAVQHMWENLGVKCELQQMQTAQLLGASEDGKLQMWLTRWYADYPEIENFLNLLDGRLVPTQPGLKSYPNSTRWNNEQFNGFFSQAIATTDEPQRLSLYAKAENIAAYEAPTIPLFYEEHYRLIHPFVRDYPLDPTNKIDLKYVWLDK